MKWKRVFTGKFLCCNDFSKKKCKRTVEAGRCRFVASYRHYRAISVAETSLTNYSDCRVTSQKSEGATSPSRKPEM